MQNQDNIKSVYQRYEDQGQESMARSVIFHIIIIVVIVAALFLASSIFLKQQEAMRRVNRRAKELVEMQKAVDYEAEIIKNQEEQISNRENLEFLARNELGMLKPGEIVFKDPLDQSGLR